MKLTAKIAASYFGAEVRCAPYGGPPDRKIIGTMIGLNNDGIHVKFPEWQSHQHQVAIGVCQLILTPLGEISDEDAMEVVKIWYKGSEKISTISIDEGKRIALSMCVPSEITDYLRSKSYNIGYGKYTAQDLVNEGVVILNHENKGI